jgi:hypothetical protein
MSQDLALSSSVVPVPSVALATVHTELRSNDDKLYSGCSEIFLIQGKPAKEATLRRSFSSAAQPFCP